MTFTAQIESFIAASQELTEAVIKDACQEMAIEASRDEGKGGRMHVQTGFLRNSIGAAIGTLPSGASENPGISQPSLDLSQVGVVIDALKLGQVLFIGWTANYAVYREAQDGFMRTAAQDWPQFINASTAKLRAAYGLK